MILLAKRLAREESNVDKEQFVAGLIDFTPEKGKKKALKGLISGYLLGRAISSTWRPR